MNGDMSFEQAFEAYRTGSYRFRLRPGDARDHECGWLVRPTLTVLPGGWKIRVCHGCGSCFRDDDNAAAVEVAA